MGGEPRRLDDLIASVADGTPLEWDALEAGAASEAERRMLKHLRIIAGVAEVHRTAGEEPGDTGRGEHGPAGVTPDLPTFAGPVKRWGHLLLLERLGEGSYGEVYRARDPWLDREVALKLLKGGPGGSVPVDRVLHEGRTLARVQHRNVVTVLGADVHEGRVGLWMEFVPGQTLEEQITRNGPLGAEEAAWAGRALCDALTAVHHAGLVHRDVKTQNVMREPGGRLVLMDFGAGQASERARGVSARPVGTPLYLAPEVLGGGSATKQSDIYALGVLLYRLVTGEYPLSAASIDELTRAHSRGERRVLEEVRPDLPKAFTAVIDRACHPDPDERFASARAMEAALTAAVTPAGDRGRTEKPWWRLLAIAGLLVAASVTAILITRPDGPRVAPPVKVVAVLPLQTDGGQNDYFADGMTEALVQELSTLDTIRVISRTSASQFKGSRQSVRDIAKALQADALVEGSVLRTDTDVRINVRLIYAGTDTPVWSRTFLRPVHDVIALQRDIAKAVAGDLPVVITPSSAERWSQVQRVSPESYDAYLRGMAALSELTLDGKARARALFVEAVRLDPQNARAHAGIAIVHADLAGRTAAVAQEASAARTAANRALEIDPQLPEAHAVLAQMLFYNDWDWNGADQRFRQALAANPSLQFAREWYAMFLAARRRLDEARAQMTEARVVDPLSQELVVAHAGLLRYARQYDGALALYDQVLERHPRHVVAGIGRGRTLIALQRFDDAIAQYQRLQALEQGDTFFDSEIAQAHAGAGRRAEALDILARIDPDRRPGAVTGSANLAYVYAQLGDEDGAFRWLTRAFDARAAQILWLPVDSRLDPLRADARFAALLGRLGMN